MSSYIEQIKRMREAREKDESPLAAALNRVEGVKAQVNDTGDAAENRRQGDVHFVITFPPLPGGYRQQVDYWVESQVSRRHTKFSYSADKVGKYEGEYVYLACIERDEGLSTSIRMIHVIVKRRELEEVLDRASHGEVKGVYLHEKDGRKFWTIYPTALAGCKSAVFGSSIDSVVTDLIESIIRPK